MEFYDAHSHIIEEQSGGFLIALEGQPFYDGIPNNNNIIEYCKDKNLLFPVQYVSKSFNKTTTSVLKYHPQRENYEVFEVFRDIKNRKPKLIIIDTLGEPFWNVADYWKLIKACPDFNFILAHSGGWNIKDYIKIPIIEPNVWIDFSWTQHYFGWCGDEQALNQNIDVINYAMNHRRLKYKILFGSDNPFYSQETALDKYINIDNEDFLKNNFLKLINESKLI